MWQELLQQHAGELIAAVQGGSQLDANEAERLVPPAVDGIGSALQGGGLDLSSLLGGGSGAVGALLGQLDVGRIAAAAGLDEGKAREGLQALIPVVMSLLGDKAGGAEGLLSLLGGEGESGGASGLGALGGIAGKLLGR